MSIHPYYLCALLVLLPLASLGAHYFVAPHGNDAWSGTRPAPTSTGTDGPFRTLARASGLLQPGDVCEVRAGVYRETLHPARSGEATRPIIIRAYRDERPVLVGTDVLADWRQEDDRCWSAPMPWDLADQNQLFAGETMLTEARWPNNAGTLLQPTRAVAAGGSASTLTDPTLPGTPDAWTGATLWCAGGHQWICWAAPVTGFDPATRTLTFTPTQKEHWYLAKAGSPYVLMGVRAALDAPGEWWYDRANRRLWLIPPAGTTLADAHIEAKRRSTVIDLRDRAYIHLIGLHFRAGGLQTNAASHDLRLEGLRGTYLAHSYRHDVGRQGVIIAGQRHLIQGCEFSNSSSTVMQLTGNDHRVYNCFLHDGDYGGMWSGAVKISGRRHHISHNSIWHSGRDVLCVFGLSESVVEYNDLAHAGWITYDLGMTYGHTTDFAGTEFRYNWVHDNHAKSCAMGIYFDHLSLNAIVHHNLIWNVSGDPVRVNNPGYFMLVYHNSAYNTGSTTTFDHANRQDLFGVRYQNNLVNGPIRLTPNAQLAANLVAKDPGYVNARMGDFRLRPESSARKAAVPLTGLTAAGNNLGAFSEGQRLWRAGHDFVHPPTIPPMKRTADIPYRNLLRNSAFELPTLEGWTPTGLGTVELSKGNNWGTKVYGTDAPTGTCARELHLTGPAGVEQTVTGVRPKTRYQLSAWIKRSAPTVPVVMGVRGTARPAVTVSPTLTDWQRVVLEFDSGPEATSLSVFITIDDRAGAGEAWVDNCGLVELPGRDGGAPP